MTLRTCPRCQTRTGLPACCGIELTVRRKPWRMTADRVRHVHVLARSRKGLSDEDYRLRLGAVGVDSSLKLSRDQFLALVDGLNRLPDAPAWLARKRHSGSSSAPTMRRARG